MKSTLDMSYMKNIQLNRKQKKIVLGICTCLVLIVILSTMIWAKFIKKDSVKSVSSASGFYFSSNRLSNIEENNVADYAQHVVEGWSGGSGQFGFKIRDYENPLLYNKKGQSISYEITASVLDSEGDVIESDLPVRVFIDTTDITVTAHEGTIGGEVQNGAEDMYNSIDYIVSIEPYTQPMTSDVKIRLDVRTTDSPYPRHLGAVVVWKYTASSGYLAEKGFKQIKADGLSVDKYTYEGEEITNTDYALVYGIGTGIGASSENMDTANAVTKLHYWWRNDRLRFDRFDNLLLEKYQTVENSEVSPYKSVLKIGETVRRTVINAEGQSVTEDVVLTMDNMKDFTQVVIIDASTEKGHIFFETVAYSYYNIIMYKRRSDTTPLYAETAQNIYADVEVVTEFAEQTIEEITEETGGDTSGAE